MNRFLRSVPVLVALLPSVAYGADVVLPPMLADGTIEPKQRTAVNQLLASELDFSPAVDSVIELPAAPPSLDEACLANPKCLGGIASANEGDSVIAGKITLVGSAYQLDLVFFQGGRIVRRSKFAVSKDPTELSNAMTPIVQELMTGQTAESPAAAPSVASLDFDDDLELGEEIPEEAPAPVPAPRPAPRPVPVPVAVAPAPDPVPVAPAPVVPASVAPSAPVDRRLAAASAATGLATGNAPPGASADELAAMITFGAPPGIAPAPEPEPGPEPEEFVPAPTPTRPPPTSAPRPAPRPAPKPSGGGDPDHLFQLTARGGYSTYYTFNFLTVGAEAALPVFKGLHVVAGVETYAVKRVLPVELALQTGILSKWNYIFPLNAGAVYKIPLGVVSPYVGADLITVQYYQDAIGSDWAAGGRFRGGADVAIVEHFGLNVNVSAGAWFGQNWALLEDGVRAAGFLPQISAGTVFSF